MAVTITDNRTIINEADSTTGWSNNIDNADTSAPDPVESVGRIGTQVSNEIQNVIYTAGTSANLTNTLFYLWALPGGVLDTTQNGGVGLILGDGTNTVAYYVGGSDGSAFRHEEGPVFWQCFAMDTGNLPTLTATISGNSASIDFSQITEFGVRFKTLAKSVGGVANCFNDIMRYGNGGITLTAGTSGTPATFEDIDVEDRATGNQQAYGILRKLGSGLFGCQGALTFGDSVGTAAHWFEDTNVTMIFEDRGFAADKYSITVTGNTTGNTNFILGQRGGVGLGSNGCSLTVPAGVSAGINASNANVNEFSLYGCNINGFDDGITLSSDATNAPNHEIFATNFVSCGLITVGLTEFINNSITTSVGTSAVLLSDTTNVSDLSFVSSGTGHAITIETPGTYDFTNFTYSGYATTDGTTGNEVFYNNSGGLVTINVVGGDTPTVRNGAGASTTVNNNIAITLQDMYPNTEVRIYAAGTTTEIAGIETVTDQEVGNSEVNNYQFTFSVGAGTALDIKVFNTEYLPIRLANQSFTSNTTLPIQQVFDRNYSNP